MIKTKFDDGVFEVGETVVTVTSGGLTTWIEMFKHGKEKETGTARILQPVMIMGDTQDLLSWARKLISDIKKEELREFVESRRQNDENQKSL